MGSALRDYIEKLNNNSNSIKREELIILHIKEDKRDVYRNRAMSITGLIAVVGLLALSIINIDTVSKSSIEGFDSIVEYSKSILYVAIASLFGTCATKSIFENKELIKDINEVIEEEKLPNDIKSVRTVKQMVKSLFNKKK